MSTVEEVTAGAWGPSRSPEAEGRQKTSLVQALTAFLGAAEKTGRDPPAPRCQVPEFTPHLSPVGEGWSWVWVGMGRGVIGWGGAVLAHLRQPFARLPAVSLLRGIS